MIPKAVYRMGQRRLLAPQKIMMQRVSFSSSTTDLDSIQDKDPFRILGIPPGSSYSSAKEAFIRLALQCHPDLCTDKTNQNLKSKDTFIRIRQALESIRQQHRKDSPNTNTNDIEEEADWTDAQWQDFLQEQASLMFAFNLDHQTRKEIVQAVEQYFPADGGENNNGMLDSQGTWYMARMLAQQQRSTTAKNDSGEPDSKGQAPIRQLTSGRRARRRKR